MGNELIIDADTEYEVDLSDASSITPTEDVDHSILEPMKITPLRLPQKRIEKMLESYDRVVVNDFRDMYHMPEEERKQAFQFYEVFKKLNQTKTKHRVVSSYVNAMRIRMEALETVAESNGIYEKDEFIKKVLKGKINVCGLKKPKYIGSGKKDINWDLVAEYIMDPERDATELDKKENTSFYDLVDEDDILELENHLGMSISEYIESTNPESTDKVFKELDIDETETTGLNIAIPMTKKFQKELIKDHKEILYVLKSAKKDANRARKLGYTNQYTYTCTQDAMLEISKMDELTGRLAVPEFKGDALNKADVECYMKILDEFEMKNTTVEINGRTYTLEEAEDIKLKNMLEANGFDIRKFYSYKKDEKKAKKEILREKKRVKRLKKKLKSARERYEIRESKGGVNGKKKKAGKEAKKKQKNMNNVHPGGYSNFDDYAKSMERWND